MAIPYARLAGSDFEALQEMYRMMTSDEISAHGESMENYEPSSTTKGTTTQWEMVIRNTQEISNMTASEFRSTTKDTYNSVVFKRLLLELQNLPTRLCLILNKDQIHALCIITNRNVQVQLYET